MDIPEQPIERISLLSRLRTRMAASYVAVTLAIVLLLEALVVGTLLYVFTRSPLPGYVALQMADHTAEVLALQAALQAGDGALSPASTFAPGQAGSLVAGRPEDEASLSWLQVLAPYVAPGQPAPQLPVVALLVDSDGRVFASSYPDRYPVASAAAGALGEDATLVRAALRGEPDGALMTRDGVRYATAARTVRNRSGEAIGAVVVRTPAGTPSDQSLLTELAIIVLSSGVLWLCLMLPVGLTFGFLSTRGLIRRIERLAGATARFRDGDTAIRVPVSRADEVGQLEAQFNLMAGELLAGFAERQALVEQSARAQERARIEQEMSSALYIQRALLPEELPSVRGWQIEAHYSPAQAVGGDLYDFLPLPGGRIGIAIGDATGKGLPSALLMATTCSTLRAAAYHGRSPGDVLALVNGLLYRRIPEGTFATCFYAILDPHAGRLQYANAGHNLPYLLRNGDVVELEARGMPLGLMPKQRYEEQEVALAAQDCILFYSDGLVEAHTADGEMFGGPRLKGILQEQEQAAALGDILLRALAAFGGPGWEQEDDVTLVTLRRTAPVPAPARVP